MEARQKLQEQVIATAVSSSCILYNILTSPRYFRIYPRPNAMSALHYQNTSHIYVFKVYFVLLSLLQPDNKACDLPVYAWLPLSQTILSIVQLLYSLTLFYAVLFMLIFFLCPRID